MNAIVGKSDSFVFSKDDHQEIAHWIGKPWRRVELLIHRFFYKGEMVDRTWDLTFHLGLRRLGVGFTFSVIRSRSLDYSDEPNQ